MADEQNPGGSEAPSPPGGEGPKPPAKPAAEAAKPAPPKPAPPKPATPPAPKPPAVMMATAWESDLARELKQSFGESIRETSTYLGQNFIVAKPDAAIPILEYRLDRTARRRETRPGERGRGRRGV